MFTSHVLSAVRFVKSDHPVSATATVPPAKANAPSSRTVNRAVPLLLSTLSAVVDDVVPEPLTCIRAAFPLVCPALRLPGKYDVPVWRSMLFPPLLNMVMKPFPPPVVPISTVDAVLVRLSTLIAGKVPTVEDDFTEKILPVVRVALFILTLPSVVNLAHEIPPGEISTSRATPDPFCWVERVNVVDDHARLARSQSVGVSVPVRHTKIGPAAPDVL